jgi:hypothetical protein
MSNRQVASRLGIAEGTIKRHLANVYPKMDVSSRGEAVRVALENEASMDEEEADSLFFWFRPYIHELPRRSVLRNSKGQGRKKKKKAFGVTDSASL